MLFTTWDESVLQEVLQSITEGGDWVDQFYPMCRAIVNKIIPSSAMFALLADEKVKTQKHVIDNLIDVLWGISMEVKEEPNAKEELLAFIQALIEKNHLSKQLCLERLERDLLEELKLISSAKSFHTKMSRINTANIFKQQKFNLFHEESEGYSKLIHLLNDTSIPSSVLPNRFTCLIGQFDIDPNRAFDLVLNIIDKDTSRSEDLVQLLEHVSSTTLLKLIRFNFQKEGGEKGGYNTMALLLKKNLVSMADLLPLLYTEGESNREAEYGVFEADLQKLVQSFRLSAISNTDLSETRKSNELLPTTELERIQKELTKSYYGSQVLQLFEALLHYDNWDIIERFYGFLSPVEIASYMPIAKSLCMRADAIIFSLYEQTQGFSRSNPYSNSFAVTEAKDISQLKELLFPTLYALGPYLYVDSRVFKHVLVVLHFSLKGKPLSDDAFSWIEDLLGKVLLPALSCSLYIPTIAEFVWDILLLFPYPDRFRIYFRWGESYDSHPLLKYMKLKTVEESKSILKRLTANNSDKQGQMISKISDANPCLALHQIVLNVQSYENLITSSVNALSIAKSSAASKGTITRELSMLSRDVLSYLIVLEIGSTQQRSETQIPKWVTFIHRFTGTLCSKLNLDLSAILQFTYNQLKCFTIADIGLLVQLLVLMNGREHIQKLTSMQMKALFGGELLQTEIFVPNHISFKSSRKRLARALNESQLIVPLLIILAQIRTKIIYDSEIRHLKLMGKAFDKCHSSLLLFVDFLHNKSIPTEKLVSTLPTIRTLLLEYRIPPEIVFHLYRPVLPFVVNDSFRRNASPNIEGDTMEDKRESLMEIVKEFLGEERKDFVLFYSFFWSFALPDIKVPSDLYTARIEHHKNAGKSNQNLDAKLETEMEDHNKNQKHFLEKFAEQQSNWFKNVPPQDVTSLLFQLCLFPRCINSKADALFCAKFVYLMHKNGVPVFNTLMYNHRLVQTMECLMFSFTPNEAENFGLFLLETLQMINRWKSKEFYDKQKSLPGFSKEMTSGEESESTARPSFEEIEKVFSQLSVKLVHIFKACLYSGEYLVIYNALVILHAISDVFPVPSVAKNIEKYINKIVDGDPREDLKIIAERTRDIINVKLRKYEDKDAHADPSEAMDTKEDIAVKKESSSSAGSKRSRQEFDNTSKDDPKGAKDARDIKDASGAPPSRKTSRTVKTESGTEPDKESALSDSLTAPSSDSSKRSDRYRQNSGDTYKYNRERGNERGNSERGERNDNQRGEWSDNQRQMNRNDRRGNDRGQVGRGLNDREDRSGNDRNLDRGNDRNRGGRNSKYKDDDQRKQRRGGLNKNRSIEEAIKPSGSKFYPNDKKGRSGRY